MISPSLYADRASRFLNEAKHAEKIVTRYAALRLGLVVSGIVIYFALPSLILFIAVPALIAAFVIFMRLQLTQEDLKKRYTNLYELNLKEEKALNFLGSDFPDGQAFVDVNHPYSHDLDLFGKGSVFQYINRSATWMGETWLAFDLNNISTADHSKKTLLSRQQAVQELASMVDFRQHAWALGQQVDDGPLNHTLLREWLKDTPFIINKPILEAVRLVLPALTMLALALTLYQSDFYPYLLMLMAIQGSIAGSYRRQIKRFQQQLSHVNKVLSNYSRLFELLASQKVHSPLMKKHHVIAQAAHAHVKAFSSLVNALESRMNFIAMVFGNALFLYDLHTVSSLERWRKKYGADLPGWLDSLAEWDSLLSPATLHANFPEYAFAESAATNTLEMTDAGHLLIPNNVRVTNSFSIGTPQSVWLITGANMAGKSTFLRAIGVNFVLGSMGSPVCASHWSMPLIALRTGMRTTDSLQEHQSYFFAELNRLQSIMEELRSGKPMLILLDEILKGTNSTDKQLGSRELLKQFKDMNALVVLATHDIALGDLEQLYPQQIANACFEGKIVKNDLSFDYTLQAGVAQKANATFLMRKMGIIPSERS
jgi:DNA mismatch repair ATPase MutS